MFRSILVPLDGSGFSEQALPLAEILGGSPGTQLHLGRVHVEHPPELYGSTEAASPGQPADPKEAERRYLTDLVQRLQSGGIEADAKLMDGDVVEAIEDWAQTKNADLIVMATHGRSTLERLRLGSVAASLVSRGLAPMLLIHPKADGDGHAPSALEHVVVALDHSPFAQTILADVKALGAVAGTRCYTLLHVAETKGVGKAGWTPLTTVQSRAQEELEKLGAGLAGPDTEIHTRVVTGAEPSTGILQAAQEAKADAIAMTTHGMTGLRPTLLGSVAAQVLHSWEGPMLLRRPDSSTS